MPCRFDPMKRALVHVSMLLAVVGCSDSDPDRIAQQFEDSGRRSVDLASAVPGDWERVCVFGPYSGNADAEKALGFEWPLEALTDIDHEGSSLLVFVQGGSVVHDIEHPRRAGDFSNLTGRCFARTNARFVHVARPPKGWAGLFPMQGTLEKPDGK